VSKRFLYQFYWDCGRSGSLEGLFVATEKEVEDAIGAYMYFGEVLGKHSEVYGDLEKGDITKLNVSPEAVEEVAKHLGTSWSGFNPLDYIETRCDSCREECDEEDLVQHYDEMVCKYCYEDLTGEKYEED